MSGGVSPQEEEWDYMECLKNFQSNQEAEKSKDPPVKGIQLEKPKPGEEPSDCESLSASDSEEDPLSSRKPSGSGSASTETSKPEQETPKSGKLVGKEKASRYPTQTQIITLLQKIDNGKGELSTEQAIYYLQGTKHRGSIENCLHAWANARKEVETDAIMRRLRKDNEGLENLIVAKDQSLDGVHKTLQKKMNELKFQKVRADDATTKLEKEIAHAAEVKSNLCAKIEKAKETLAAKDKEIEKLKNTVDQSKTVMTVLRVRPTIVCSFPFSPPDTHLPVNSRTTAKLSTPCSNQKREPDRRGSGSGESKGGRGRRPEPNTGTQEPCDKHKTCNSVLGSGKKSFTNKNPFGAINPKWSRTRDLSSTKRANIPHTEKSSEDRHMQKNDTYSTNFSGKPSDLKTYICPHRRGNINYEPSTLCPKSRRSRKAGKKGNPTKLSEKPAYVWGMTIRERQRLHHAMTGNGKRPQSEAKEAEPRNKIPKRCTTPGCWFPAFHKYCHSSEIKYELDPRSAPDENEYLCSPQHALWKNAMEKELDRYFQSGTFKLVKTCDVKKRNSGDQVVRWKSGRDYDKPSFLLESACRPITRAMTTSTTTGIRTHGKEAVEAMLTLPYSYIWSITIRERNRLWHALHGNGTKLVPKINTDGIPHLKKEAQSPEEFIEFETDLRGWLSVAGCLPYVIGPAPTAPTEATKLAEHHEKMALGLRYICAAIDHPDLKSAVATNGRGKGPEGFKYLRNEFLQGTELQPALTMLIDNLRLKPNENIVPFKARFEKFVSHLDPRPNANILCAKFTTSITAETNGYYEDCITSAQAVDNDQNDFGVYATRIVKLCSKKLQRSTQQNREAIGHNARSEKASKGKTKDDATIKALNKRISELEAHLGESHGDARVRKNGGKNHQHKESPGNRNTKPSQDRDCVKCGKKGHMAKDCKTQVTCDYTFPNGEKCNRPHLRKYCWFEDPSRCKDPKVRTLIEKKIAAKSVMSGSSSHYLEANEEDEFHGVIIEEHQVQPTCSSTGHHLGYFSACTECSYGSVFACQECDYMFCTVCEPPKPNFPDSAAGSTSPPEENTGPKDDTDSPTQDLSTMPQDLLIEIIAPLLTNQEVANLDAASQTMHLTLDSVMANRLVTYNERDEASAIYEGYKSSQHRKNWRKAMQKWFDEVNGNDHPYKASLLAYMALHDLEEYASTPESKNVLAGDPQLSLHQALSPFSSEITNPDLPQPPFSQQGRLEVLLYGLGVTPSNVDPAFSYQANVERLQNISPFENLSPHQNGSMTLRCEEEVDFSPYELVWCEDEVNFPPQQLSNLGAAILHPQMDISDWMGSPQAYLHGEFKDEDYLYVQIPPDYSNEDLEEPNQGVWGMMGIMEPSKPPAEDLTVGTMNLSRHPTDIAEYLFVDSGASDHIVHDSRILIKLEQHRVVNIRIRTGNGVSTATRRGPACFTVKDSFGKPYELIRDVIYCKNFGVNLFSVNKDWKDHGTRSEFEDILKLTLKDGTIIPFEEHNNTYRLYFDLTSVEAHKGKILSFPRGVDPASIWHRRMGHQSFETVRNLAKNSAGVSLELTSAEAIEHQQRCTVCPLSRMKATPHPQNRSKGILTKSYGDRIHMDLAGPIDVPDYETGGRYITVFVDEWSGHLGLYVIAHKSDHHLMHKQYCADMASVGGMEIKEFHSDNGGEFMSNEYKNMITENGARKTTIVAKTPNLNPHAEGAMYRIFCMVRSMLVDSGLPKEHWGAAALHAAYILNRTPRRNRPGRPHDHRSPYEMLQKRPPNLSNLKIFGCLAHGMIAKKDRSSKIAEVAITGFYYGHSRTQRGFRLWCPTNDRIVTVHTAHFDEHTMYKDVIKITPTVSPTTEGTETSSDEEEPEIHNPGGGAPRFGSPSRNLRPRNSGINYYERGNSSTAGVIKPKTAACLINQDLDLEHTQETNDDVVAMIAGRKESKIVVNDDGVSTTQIKIPHTYDEAMKGENAEEWKTAIQTEYEAHIENTTWKLVPISETNGQKIVGSTWTFDVKRDAKGHLSRYKARLCAQGFSQLEGVDYLTTFSNTVNHNTLRLILAVSALRGLHLSGADIKTAYLYGIIEKGIKVFMRQPRGFEKYKDGEPMACQLIRSIYGLRQSGARWEARLMKFLISIGFQRSDCDPCLYKIQKGNDYLWLCVYVDDLTFAATSKKFRDHIFKIIQGEFNITDTGDLTWILNTNISQNLEEGSVTISQKVYIDDTVRIFFPNGIPKTSGRTTPCDPTIKDLEPLAEGEMVDQRYRSGVGKLVWLVSISRPDVAYAHSMLARHNQGGGERHMQHLLKAIAYLGRTSHYKITYGKKNFPEFCKMIENHSDFKTAVIDPETLICFTDASHGGERPMAGMLLMIGSSPLAWKAYRAACTPLSVCEGEYIAASKGAVEVLATQHKADFIKVDLKPPTLIFNDNKSAVDLADNNTSSKRMKHIATRIAFLREQIADKTIMLYHIRTEGQLADIFTKALLPSVFHYLRSYLIY